jgi:hypothetical protein
LRGFALVVLLVTVGVATAPTLAAPGTAPDPAAAAATAKGADAPTVTARVDKAEARVGDAITVTVTAVGPRGTPVNLPSTLELSPFSILDRKEEEKDLGDGKMRRDFTLRVAAYEPGEISVPSVEVTYLGKAGEVLTASTAPVPIKITSLLANEPEPALKENAAPVAVLEQNLLAVYVAAGLAAAALGGLVALYLRKRWRARAAERRAPPPRPPHELALERLDRLGAGGFSEDGSRPFYFTLSEIIREYLGARFGFDSLEMTTEELVDELRRRQPGSLILTEVTAWLGSCDLVKFAKTLPSETEARGALETAIRIVESTRPRPEPLAEAASAAAARKVANG